MKFPVFLAHGEGALLAFGGMIVVANAVALAAVVIATRKKKDAMSISGLIFGAVGFLLALAMASLMRWRFERDPFTCGVASLFLFSVLGMALSIRKKNA